MVRWLKGVDLRELGSGNMGTMNARRVLGTGPAALVFLLDAGKGVAAALLGLWWVAGDPSPWVRGGAGLWQWGWWVPAAAAAPAFLCAAAAAAGHVWPVFARFRGGKALATSFGAVLVLSPGYVLALAAVFAFVLFFAVRAAGVRRERRMGVAGALVAVTAVALAGWAWGNPAGPLMTLPWAAMVLYPHAMEAAGRRGGGAMPPPPAGR